MKPEVKHLTAILAWLCLGVGCTAQETPRLDVPDREQRASADSRVLLGKKHLERLPPRDESARGQDASVPETVVRAAETALLKFTGAPIDSITLVRSRSVVWNDGALGCPVPGMMYTQALVSGYQVVLEYNAREYDYRSNGKGYLLLCLNEGSGGGVAPLE